MRFVRRAVFLVVAAMLTAVSLPTSGAATTPGWQEPTRRGWKDDSDARVRRWARFCNRSGRTRAERLRAFGIALVVVSSLGLTEVPRALAERSPGDVVIDWNATALATAAREHVGPVIVLDLAIVHAAVYDAVNSIDRQHTPYAVSVQDAPEGASQEVAAATAAHRVLLHLFPSQDESLAARYAESLAAVPDGEAKAQGVAVGETAAAAIIALRSDDGRFAHVPYEPGSGPGAWVSTPPFPPDFPPLVPWVAQVTPFTMRSDDQFTVDPPPALTSDQYTRDVEEVRTMGARYGSARTEEQTAIARFFGEPPVGAWNRTVQGIARGRGQSVAENARLFALVNLAAADANIASWQHKYTYKFWRPITAIRAADTDGNPDTAPDPTWEPLLITPPFPEYTAGHTVFSGAVAQVLRDFYGTDRFDFTMSSAAGAGGSGATRSYTRFSHVVNEVVDARVWAGSHFRTADVVGAAAGMRVGRWVSKNVALPVG